MNIDIDYSFTAASAAGSVDTISMTLSGGDRSGDATATLDTNGMWVVEGDRALLWRAVFAGALLEAADLTGDSAFYLPPAVAARIAGDTEPAAHMAVL